ncbi:uncharacterized protein LOC113291013 [Papaver somniferum]|uniref:uncharacterized protein LOC113291013 n=1 Tax=Papaver somniferum TaxID=3469 RepID=UPI000E70602F|nr:uncharacterized protein LOC113291013 [Papaver somniferum]
MLDSKPCDTHVVKAYRVSIHDGVLLDNADVHLQLVKRTLWYLKGTIGLGITLHSGDLHSLKAFTDSDWAGCPDTRRSTSRYAVFIGSNLISWSLKKQPTVSKSSAEAEYKCLSVAAAELEWLKSLLSKLHITI